MLGFVVNREKSQLIPTQVIQYFGLMVDAKDQAVRGAGNVNYIL